MEGAIQHLGDIRYSATCKQAVPSPMFELTAAKPYLTTIEIYILIRVKKIFASQALFAGNQYHHLPPYVLRKTTCINFNFFASI